MVAAVAAAYWLLSDSQFRLDTAQVAGNVRYTDVGQALIAAGVGSGQHPNLFGVRSAQIERVLLSNPAIASAQVTTELPNHVSIALTERAPILALRRAGTDYLVADDGAVVAAVDDARAASLGLPIVDDQRAAPPGDVTVGGQLDSIDFDAITQLGALTPAGIDSRATSLRLQLSDDNGFVIAAVPDAWQAIFGSYTPNLRPTNMIPRQVQCLRSLLGAHEPEVSTIYLAPLDDRCGTYAPVATPTPPARATPTPRPPR